MDTKLHRLNLVLVLTLALAVISGLATPVLREAVAAVVEDASEQERAALDWAVARFEETDLALPPLHVSFHHTTDECRGFNGTYGRSGVVAVIDICNPRVHTILHELGHAWEAAAVDDSTRARFMEYHGITSWSDLDVLRGDRGIEVAATTLAMVLNWRSGQVSDAGFRSKFCGYEILTEKDLPPWVPIDCDTVVAPAG